MPFSACKGKRTAQAVQPLCAFFYTGNSRPLLKGRDIVNVFRSRDAFVGQGEAAVFCVVWEEFLSLAERLRRELGARK